MVLFQEYGYFCHNISTAEMKCGQLESGCRGGGDGEPKLDAVVPRDAPFPQDVYETPVIQKGVHFLLNHLADPGQE